MPRNKNKFKPEVVETAVDEEPAGPATPQDAAPEEPPVPPTAAHRPRSKSKRKELALAKLEQRAQIEQQQGIDAGTEGITCRLSGPIC